MVKKRKQSSRKNRNSIGICERPRKPEKMNASMAYRTCSEQLSPIGCLFPFIKIIDLVGFREIFHFA